MSTETLLPIEDSVICFHNISKKSDQRPQNLPYHRHDAYEIYLFLGGNTQLYIEQSCYDLIPGDLFIIDPNQLHRSVCLDSQPYDRLILNIKEEKLKQLSSQQTDLSSCFQFSSLSHGKHTHLTGDLMTRFLNLSNQFQTSYAKNEFGSDLLSNAYLTELLIFLNICFSNYSHMNDRDIMPQIVRDTMLFIANNLTEPLSLSVLEQQFHLTGAYISTQFKKHTGLTLRTYILDQRIVLAQKLLRNGYNVSEACRQSGFRDYSNFIRSFNKITGISPGKYAKKHYL